jgi:6-phosphogluconolactonase
MAQIDFLSGSYSEGAPSGIHRLRLDTATDELSVVAALPGAPDASFFVADATGRRLYVTNEPDARLGAFSLSPDALALTRLSDQPTGAGLPCHVGLSPEGTHVAVANYGAGRTTLFAIDPISGALSGDAQLLEGTQSTADGHAHWVGWSPDGRFIHVVDLGHDEVRAYPWDGARAGAPIISVGLDKGAGPRHLAFDRSGQFAFLITEYANTLTALRVEGDGRLSPIETHSTLPKGYAEKSFGAHIQVVGSMVYVSNRGHNSIAAFRIGPEGRLTLTQIVPTGGNWPRFFLAIDAHLLVCNQLSDDITLFTLQPDGRMGATGRRLALHKPVMLMPLD